MPYNTIQKKTKKRSIKNLVVSKKLKDAVSASLRLNSAHNKMDNLYGVLHKTKKLGLKMMLKSKYVPNNLLSPFKEGMPTQKMKPKNKRTNNKWSKTNTPSFVKKQGDYIYFP